VAVLQEDDGRVDELLAWAEPGTPREDDAVRMALAQAVPEYRPGGAAASGQGA